MKPNYQEPFHTLKQILQETSDSAAELAYAVVVGPLYRHTTDESLIWKAFLPDTSTSYTMNSGGSVLTATGDVDLGYVEVLARNVDVQIWSGKDGVIYSPTILKFDTAFLDTESAAVADAFDEGRWVQPGDILLIDDGSTVVRRRAVELLGEDQPATLTNYNAFGAAELVTAETTLISSSILAIEQADVSSAQTNAAFAVWIRQNGIIGTYAGLGVLLEVECSAPGADADAATFIFRANGEVVTGTAAMDGSDAEFDFQLGAGLSTLQLVLDYDGAWTAGQKVAVRHDAPVTAAAEADYFGSPDLSGYTMLEATSRVNGQISIEILSVASNTDVALRVRSSENLFAAATYNITTNATTTVALAYDGGVVEFTLDGTDIRTKAYRGLTVSAILAAPSRSTTVFDKVRLSAQVGITGSVTVDALHVFTGMVPEANDSADNYTAGASTLTLTDVSLPVPGYPGGSEDRAATASGEYAVVWRELVPPAEDESVLTIRSQQDILELLGSDHPDSEAGYGALCCLVGGEGREFKVLRTNGDSLADFEEAFSRIATVRETYALGILTKNEDVMLASAQHAFAMSDEYNKRSRRCYVGTDSPDEFFIINLKDDSSNYTADFIAGDNGNNLVETEDEDLDFSLASVGDFVVLDATGDQYLITAIADNVVTLASGPPAPLSGVAIKVLAAATAANTVKFVSQRTARLGAFSDQDRRISNIWCDRGTIGGVQQQMRFTACEIAGARVAIPPNQGMTRRAVKTISAAPNMHRKFTRTQLNQLGAAGVWIITQESPTGKVRVRHQLTIATTGGILFYEDSVGVNIDLLCFELDDLIDAEIGVVNANRRSLVNLKSKIIDKMSTFTVSDDTAEGRRLGPRIEQFYDIEENPGTITLVQDPNLKDQFNHALMVDTATPLNRVRTTLTARVTNVNGTLVSSINTIPA
jgi:hypothetical protein